MGVPLLIAWLVSRDSRVDSLLGQMTRGFECNVVLLVLAAMWVLGLVMEAIIIILAVAARFHVYDDRSSHCAHDALLRYSRRHIQVCLPRGLAKKIRPSTLCTWFVVATVCFKSFTPMVISWIAPTDSVCFLGILASGAADYALWRLLYCRFPAKLCAPSIAYITIGHKLTPSKTAAMKKTTRVRLSPNEVDIFAR